MSGSGIDAMSASNVTAVCMLFDSSGVFAPSVGLLRFGRTRFVASASRSRLPSVDVPPVLVAAEALEKVECAVAAYSRASPLSRRDAPEETGSSAPARRKDAGRT